MVLEPELVQYNPRCLARQMSRCKAVHPTDKDESDKRRGTVDVDARKWTERPTTTTYDSEIVSEGETVAGEGGAIPRPSSQVELSPEPKLRIPTLRSLLHCPLQLLVSEYVS